MSQPSFHGSFPSPAAVGEATTAALCGEIYNLPQLAGGLGLPASAAPAAVLSAGWRRWGIALLPRLNGVFALALRDGDRLLLYRDPSGLQDLFWHKDPAGPLSFATELGQLLRFSGAGRRIDRHALHEYLRFLDIATPRTFFEGVRSLEPGQALRCDAAGAVTFETPERADDRDASGAAEDFEAAVDALDSSLRHAIALRLAGAANPAAFLSGGVDSSLICALARSERPDLTALTVGFDAAPHDEGPVAARVAAQLGVAHQVLRFGRDAYLGAFGRLCRTMGQPMADPATPATLLAFDHCRGRFDAVLDGTGADEAMGMMPPRHVRLAVGYASLLPARARAALAWLARATPGLSAYAPILDFDHPADTMIRWKGFTRPEIQALCGEAVSFEGTRFYRTFARFPRHAHFERGSALLEAMPCGRLNQAALACGLQVRYPFADPQTDGLLRNLPVDWRWTPDEPKRILRALLARHVPREIWDLPKHGFDFPLHAFLAADDFSLVRRYLDRDRWHRAGLLNADLVDRYAVQFIAGDRALGFRVWALVVLAAWLENQGEPR